MRGIKVKRVLQWVIEYDVQIVIALLCALASGYLVYGIFQYRDTDSTIHRTIRAYRHTPEGNTEIYYDGGGLTIDGEWYFNLDTGYEFYREENSTVWHVDPY